MPVTLTFYDGTDCIGGNKILLEDGGAALLFDFGTNFSAEGRTSMSFFSPGAASACPTCFAWAFFRL